MEILAKPQGLWYSQGSRGIFRLRSNHNVERTERIQEVNKVLTDSEGNHCAVSPIGGTHTCPKSMSLQLLVCHVCYRLCPLGKEPPHTESRGHDGLTKKHTPAFLCSFGVWWDPCCNPIPSQEFSQCWCPSKNWLGSKRVQRQWEQRLWRGLVTTTFQCAECSSLKCFHLIYVYVCGSEGMHVHHTYTNTCMGQKKPLELELHVVLWATMWVLGT